MYVIRNITGAKPTPGRRGSWHVVICLLAVALLLWSTSAHAANRSCEGPAICCPATIAEDLPERVEVTVGIVLLGMYNVNEKSGTWDADFYLHEAWRPTPGFVPQTEVVNEAVRQSGEFDTVELRGGRCLRSRRLRSTLHSPYNLRTFPFDHQNLTLQLSDAQFTAKELLYASRAEPAEIDDPELEQLWGCPVSC
jgi:hypothetical protein